MRGHFRDQGGLFSYISPETRVPALHPLREIRELVRAVLKDLGPSFGKLYANEGRPSIPPEQLLSALLLQAFYAIRSERQLMEQLDYNLLYRWFVGLAPDDPVWDATTFTKNRERLQRGDVFQKFMTKLLNHPQVKPLLSDEHFSVDGTLIEAWASQKSFKPKDGPGDGQRQPGALEQFQRHGAEEGEIGQDECAERDSNPDRLPMPLAFHHDQSEEGRDRHHAGDRHAIGCGERVGILVDQHDGDDADQHQRVGARKVDLSIIGG